VDREGPGLQAHDASCGDTARTLRTFHGIGRHRAIVAVDGEYRVGTWREVTSSLVQGDLQLFDDSSLRPFGERRRLGAIPAEGSPSGGADDAIDGQVREALKLLHGCLGHGTEVAVDLGVAQNLADETVLGPLDEPSVTPPCVRRLDNFQTRLEYRAWCSMAEDFTSLLGAVSTGRAPPPQVTAFHPAPFQVGCQQGDQGLDITRAGGPTSSPRAGGIRARRNRISPSRSCARSPCWQVG
jgi:hypothetical protein